MSQPKNVTTKAYNLAVIEAATIIKLVADYPDETQAFYADLLGIPERNVYRKFKQLGLNKKDRNIAHAMITLTNAGFTVTPPSQLKTPKTEEA